MRNRIVSLIVAGALIAIFENVTTVYAAEAEDAAIIADPSACFCFRPTIGPITLSLRKGCRKLTDGEVWCCTDTGDGTPQPFETIRFHGVTIKAGDKDCEQCDPN